VCVREAGVKWKETDVFVWKRGKESKTMESGRMENRKKKGDRGIYKESEGKGEERR